MKYLFMTFIMLAFISCKKNDAHDSGTQALSNYEYENIEGTDTKKAFRKGPDGNILESGFVRNGKKEGQWIEFFPNTKKRKSITSYVNGKLNGHYFEFNEQDYMVSQAEFKNDVLDGVLIKFKFNSPIEISNLKNGKLNGTKSTFSIYRKIEQEIDYKDDVIHGKMKQYDKEGKLIAEYIFENGKKIGENKIK
ncbi:MAG: hypothetical protein IPH57_13800 [Saprospiraceae bacterium]|nr:hypothetical protein [Saprospiraceae bacterium]